MKNSNKCIYENTTYKTIICFITMLSLFLSSFPTGIQVQAADADTHHIASASEKAFRFESSKVIKTYGDAPFTNKLLSGYDLPDSSMVVYSSSRPGIASIDKTGEVTIHSAGLVEIRAHIFLVNADGSTSLVDEIPYLLFVKSDIQVAAYNGAYDGTAHAAAVTPAGGGTVFYSTKEPLTSDNYDTDGSTEVPTRTDAGTTQVYYIVRPENGFVKVSEETLRQTPEFYLTGQTAIQIKKASPTLSFASVDITKSIDSGTFTNELSRKTDGIVKFSSDNPTVATVDSGTGTATVQGVGRAVITASASEGTNYEAGSASYTLTVAAGESDSLSIVSCTASLPYERITYDGNPKTPAVTVKSRTGILIQGMDYSVTYSNNVNAGTAAITVEGRGKYTGTLSKTFTIDKAVPELFFEAGSIKKQTDSSAFTNKLTAKTDGTVTFSSSNLTVASVDRTLGLVTVKEAGTAIITAEASVGTNYTSGKASYTLTVEKLSDGITVDSFQIESTLTAGAGKKVSISGVLKVKGTAQTTAGEYEQALAEKVSKIEWSSSDDSIVKFERCTYTTKDGKEAALKIEVKAKKAGNAVITGNIPGGVSASCRIVIKSASVSFNLDSLTYQFMNSRRAFGYPAGYQIPLEVFQMVFGDNAKARFYHRYYADWTGSCFGMSSTSGMFNMPDSGMAVSAFQAGANKVADLKLTDKDAGISLSLQRFIEVMQTGQFTDTAQNAIRSGENNLDDICAQVEQAKEKGPVMVCMFGPGTGHAVVAYDLVELDSARSRMYIYDCNYPKTERYIELTKDGNGHYKTWYYYLNDTYHLGTDYTGCRITYVSYTDYLNIWKNRQGTMGIYANKFQEAASGTMVTNARNAILYDENKVEIGRIVEGNLQTSREDVRQVFVLGITADEAGNTAAGRSILSLPPGRYTVKSDRNSKENLEVSMADTELGVYVSTRAQTVSLSADDAKHEVSASIEAGADESFQIELQSTSFENAGYVSATGTGRGENIEISQINGEVHTVNLEAAQIKKGALQNIKYTIMASEGEGGTVNPSGQVYVDVGGTQAFTIYPHHGYRVADVIVDGHPMGALETYVFHAVDSSHTIEAKFERIPGADTEDSSGTGTREDKTLSKGDVIVSGNLRYKVNKTMDDSGTKVNLTCLGAAAQAGTDIRIPKQLYVQGAVCKVTKIGERAFYGSTLSKVWLSGSIVSIGKGAFQYCDHLKKVTIPAKVKYIGKKAFYGCRKLKSIVIKTKKLKASGIGAGLFQKIHMNAVVKVPKGKLKKYKKMLKGANGMRIRA